MKKVNYLLIIMMLTSCFTYAQTSVGEKISVSKFTAYEKDSRLFIDWSSSSSENTNHWEIQGSNDGQKFSTIALVMGPDPAKTGEEYAYKDKLNSKNTATYYRVVRVSTTGEKWQSDIIQPVKSGASL